MVADPAEQHKGLPPKVLECSPTFSEDMISLVDKVAPIGSPPARPLATVIISGVTFQCSPAHIFPVRPNPDWISSKISSEPLSVQSSLSCGRKESGGMWTPLSPCTGSM